MKKGKPYNQIKKAKKLRKESMRRVLAIRAKFARKLDNFCPDINPFLRYRRVNDYSTGRVFYNHHGGFVHRPGTPSTIIFGERAETHIKNINN